VKECRYLYYFFDLISSDNNNLGGDSLEGTPLGNIKKRLLMGQSKNELPDVIEENFDDMEESVPHPFFWEFCIDHFWIVIFISTSITIIDPIITTDSFKFTYKTPLPSFLQLIELVNKHMDEKKGDKKLDVHDNEIVYQLSEVKNYEGSISLQTPFKININSFIKDILTSKGKEYIVYCFTAMITEVNLVDEKK
jgi:hypothetical protein